MSSAVTGLVETQIPFHDVDSLSIAWHGHYYKYFELARTEMYRNCDFDIPAMRAMGYSFPVIESHCRYAKPLVYGQHIRIEATLTDLSHYLRVAYQICDMKTGEKSAYGHTKQAVCLPDGTMLMEVPEEVRRVLET